MNMIKKIIFTSVAFVFATISFAVDTATVRIVMKDKTETKQIKLVEVEKNVFRAVVPVREIPRDALFVDIINEASRANKGENGFYVLPDGSYIDFSQDEGTITSKRLIKLLGFKTPQGCAAVIAKGMPLECNASVVVKDGKYEIMFRYDIQDIQKKQH